MVFFKIKNLIPHDSSCHTSEGFSMCNKDRHDKISQLPNRTFVTLDTRAQATFHSPLETITRHMGPLLCEQGFFRANVLYGFNTHNMSVLESSIKFAVNFSHNGFESSNPMVFDSLRFVFHLSLSISVCLWAFRPL